MTMRMLSDRHQLAQTLGKNRLVENSIHLDQFPDQSRLKIHVFFKKRYHFIKKQH